MGSRLNLHEELCELRGNRNVYFQPPASVRMNHPSIKYSRSGADQRHANDGIYNNINKYEVITMDFDPDSDMHDKMMNHFPMCRFERAYTADNIYHNVYTIYY